MSKLNLIKKKLAAVTESSYYRNAFTLISGSVIAQAVILLMTPALSRLFTTEDFGLYASFLAVTGMLSIIASLRYELAILLPKKEDDALYAFFLASFLTVFFLIPLGIILHNLTKASSYLANRIKAYKWLSISRVFGGISTGAISIFLGWQGFTVLGLIIAKTIGWIIELSISFFPAKDKVLGIIPSFSVKRVKSLAKKYQNFPKYSTPEGFLNTAFKQMPVLLLIAWFSLDIAGAYSMAFMLLSKPLGMVSSAFGQIFFQEAAALEGKDQRLVQKLFQHNRKLYQ